MSRALPLLALLVVLGLWSLGASRLPPVLLTGLGDTEEPAADRSK